MAFIWSLTSTLDKIGIQNSAPIFWVFAVYLSISIVLLPTVLLSSGSLLPQRGPVWKAFMPIGLFNAAAVACQMAALSLTLVAYVIAIKRMSAVFGVIFGWVIFRERRLKTRLLGASIMVVGVGAIALSGL